MVEYDTDSGEFSDFAAYRNFAFKQNEILAEQRKKTERQKQAFLNLTPLAWNNPHIPGAKI